MTVELFVPVDSLSCDADQWPLELDLETKPLGAEWRVVVRSLERAYGGLCRRSHPKWRRYWTHGLSLPGRAARVGTQAEVVGDVPQNVALFFAPARDEPGGGCSVLRNLIAAGVSIAVWPRKEGCENPSHRELLEHLVSSMPVTGWREAVWRYRQEAARQQDRQGHPGTHLTMLWDDPNKLPPDALGKGRGQQMPKE